jgi:predicted enzyme related to lactoylglutathione lyase
LIQAERVDFVGVPVRDLARADKFYGETLGLERNPKSGEQWIEYETGNVTLALVQERFLPTGFIPVPLIALRVPDVAEARAKLQEAGVEFEGEIIDSGVCHIAGFKDSEGNGLILHRRYAP